MLFDNSVSCAEGTPGRRGTEGWMAPEVDAGGLSTHKSDMWSLGKLLARMLSLVVRNVIWWDCPRLVLIQFRYRGSAVHLSWWYCLAGLNAFKHTIRNNAPPPHNCFLKRSATLGLLHPASAHYTLYNIQQVLTPAKHKLGWNHVLMSRTRHVQGQRRLQRGSALLSIVFQKTDHSWRHSIVLVWIVWLRHTSGQV